LAQPDTRARPCGRVEIGQSVVSSGPRHGLATEASRLLVASAWERGAETIIAKHLPDLEPSIAVLRKLGFEPSESSAPGILRFALHRV
jgi:RimJ/RimL family protein N-acetyltransferase